MRFLRGRSLPQELRYRDDSGAIRVVQQQLEGQEAEAPTYMDIAKAPRPRPVRGVSAGPFRNGAFSLGVAQNRLLHAAQTLRVPVRIVDNLKEAHIFVTTKQYYRKRPRPSRMPSAVVSPSTCCEPTPWPSSRPS